MITNFISLLAEKPESFQKIWLQIIRHTHNNWPMSLRVIAAHSGVSDSTVSRALDWGIPTLRKLGLLADYQMKVNNILLVWNQPSLTQNSIQEPTQLKVIPNEEKPEKPTRRGKNKNQCPDEYFEMVSLICNCFLTNTTKKYDPNGKRTFEPIIARIKEGKTLEQFYHVIEVKSKKWLNTEREDYLRPETLFGNKMDSYINERIITPQQQQSKPSGIEQTVRTALDAANAITFGSQDK